MSQSNSNKVVKHIRNDVVSYEAGEATVADIFTTAFSTTEAVVGGHGLVQRAMLVATGMAGQSLLAGQGLKFWAAWKKH